MEDPLNFLVFILKGYCNHGDEIYYVTTNLDSVDDIAFTLLQHFGAENFKGEVPQFVEYCFSIEKTTIYQFIKPEEVVEKVVRYKNYYGIN